MIKIIEIVIILLISLFIFMMFFVFIDDAVSQSRCNKSETRAVQLGDMLVDILFCTDPDIKIIQIYK